MNIFISHAWQNKSTALLIAESFESATRVWLGIRRQTGADATDPALNAVLPRMDAVVLLWSRDAASSPALAAEIEAARRLGRPLLPVALDGTPTTSSPIAGMFGIRFDVEDPKPGLFRIQAALAHLALANLDAESTSVLNNLSTFGGFVAYVDGFRFLRHMGESETTLWALRSIEHANRSYPSLSDLQRQEGHTRRLIQNVVARVEACGANREALQSILNEVIRNPKSQTRELKTLIACIEGRIASLSAAFRPAPKLRPGTTDAADELARKVAKASPPMERPSNSPASGGLSAETSPELELIYGYVRSAPASLQQFIQLAARVPSTAVKHVVNELHAYLTNPHDLIPDNQNGLLGLIDDAWLVHNTIYRCIEAGCFGTEDVGIAWDAIVQADPLVVRILPAPVRTMLDQLLMQYLVVIANEQAQYAPRFAPAAPFNSYNAFMGDGAAVGGSPHAGAHIVDDVVCAIGDRMVHYPS